MEELPILQGRGNSSLKFVFLGVSHSPAWVSELTDEYQKRLRQWVPTEIKILKPVTKNRQDKELKKAQESQAVLKNILPQDYVVLCDEKGKTLNTRDFSKFLDKMMGSGKKQVVFIVGGAYGVSDDVKTRADMTVSLSGFTLNHHFSTALICEQVYRGMTIIKGVNYHNDE